jgi:hypothetical protein
MDAEAVLKHRVRNEQTSREKKSPSKGVLIFYFFPAHMQIFRPIGQTFGSRRERVKEPKNPFEGTNSASLCSLAGRYDNPTPTRFLAPIDCSKNPAQSPNF